MRTAIVLLALIACELDRVSYPTRLIEARCHFDKRCRTVDFYYAYDDVKACIEENLDLWEDMAPLYDTCAFDAHDARACLSGFSGRCKKIGMQLEEHTQSCNNVYVGCTFQ